MSTQEHDEVDDTARAWIEVDRAAVAQNVAELVKRAQGARLLAVVKADAYGHGAVEIARVALRAGASYLGVATTPEGVSLRQAGIGAPVLVFGVEGAAEPVGALVAYGLTATVTTAGFARRLSEEATRRGVVARVHLKVDTGMGRVGAFPETVAQLARQCRELPGIEIEGVYSHLATADEPDLSYARRQADLFRRALDELAALVGTMPLRHLLNTAGILAMPEWSLDLVRAGIGLYGYYPAPHLRDRAALRPALKLKARLSEVRRLPKGSSVSYGRTYQTHEDAWVATVPVGYADGWTRRLSNRARCLWQGEVHPVVGRICMDQCMVETGQRRPSVGDEVCLIGPGDQGEMTVDEVAQATGTISYEIVTQLGRRLPRVYV